MNNSIKSIFDFTFLGLKEYLTSHQFSGFNADQIFDWLYRKHVFDPSQWSNLSLNLREFLQKNLDFSLPTVVENHLSEDGTRKFLLQLQDGKTIEAVLIPAVNRLTLCVSSQVGCALACKFCHTGTMGLLRHLNAGEVVGQFLVASLWVKEHGPRDKISNIVYMGQGEPLHNFENMKDATLTFLEPKGLGIGQRKITLSTSGMVPQLEKLTQFPPISLAISLHSPRNEVRDEIMPINKVYDLQKLFETLEKIPLKAHRKITFEYLLLDGINNTQEDVNALVELLPPHRSKVNLIPFNEYPGALYKRPSDEKIQWFQDQLNQRGVFSTVRNSRGRDILAACGQLKTAFEKKATRN